VTDAGLKPCATIQPSQIIFILTRCGQQCDGVEVPDIKAAVATFRQRGATVSEPNGPSAFTGGILANVTDPISGGRIELSEQPPDGKLRKATDSWKY